MVNIMPFSLIEVYWESCSIVENRDSLECALHTKIMGRGVLFALFPSSFPSMVRTQLGVSVDAGPGSSPG